MKCLEQCSWHTDSIQTWRPRVWTPLVGGESSCTHRDRPQGPPSLLYNGYQFSLPGVKQPRHGTDHQTPSSTILSNFFSNILTSVTISIIRQHKMTMTTNKQTNTSYPGSESLSCKSHLILHQSVHSTKQFKLPTVWQFFPNFPEIKLV
jgi:hypothetical protein